MTEMETKTIAQVKSRIEKARAAKHPLEKKGSGLANFSYIYFVTRPQSPKWIEENVLAGIDELILANQDCTACSKKLLAFAIRICEGKSLERSEKYKKRYDSTPQRYPRDFILEVNEAIDMFREIWEEENWRYDNTLLKSMMFKCPPPDKKRVDRQLNLFPNDSESAD